jgi:hypothetical protein
MTVASDRINQLLGLTNGNSYLEVGVEQGHTFHAVTAGNKVAVDPRFLFDVDASMRDFPHCEYHETTSDRYFEKLGPGREFDLIFLDGMHTYEQTYRDFNSALMHLAPRGIIVMDDTFPKDVYSSHRSMEMALQLRREYAEARPGWHGDTFKAVILIATFNPLIDYCTIAGNGQKCQTFLWRRVDQACVGRPVADTFQNAVHNMESSHYLWLLENVEVLNVVTSFSAVLALLANGLGLKSPA